MSFKVNLVVLRITLKKEPGLLNRIVNTVQAHGAEVIAIDVCHADKYQITRDITIDSSSPYLDAMIDALKAISGVSVSHHSDPAMLMHLGGKIAMHSKVPIKHRSDLAMAYTPGVAGVCRVIHQDPSSVYNLTIKRNMVAIVTDGSAVLGLGNIGPEAAIPVMEGKAQLLKDFAGVDAFPICLNTQDSEEIIETVARISSVFGAVNLEDIAAPRCFEIEKRLDDMLDIPIFHDDQHGTAIVMAAALINSLKITKKDISAIRVVINGVGAAGHACMKMLKALGVQHIVGCDSRGIVSLSRSDLNSAKREFAEETGVESYEGTLKDAIKGSDVFVGVSAPNVLDIEDIQNMNSDPIVFAMANPDPEISPEKAAPYVAVMATGRSDYPNQINNVLAFPGIFRGVLDCRASKITQEMHIAAVYAIASAVDESVLSPDYVIPSVFDKNVADAVAQAVIGAATPDDAQS